MKDFVPARVLYEKKALEYPQGLALYRKYKEMGIEVTEVENHHNIRFVREADDRLFTRFKRYLVLGVRKSMKLTENPRSADYIVPFTSSGCSAMCSYCYLVCTFFKSSYLRVFVNREEMLDAMKRQLQKENRFLSFELGSNSDLVLENRITNNLPWIIGEFAKMENTECTFSTKFSMVDSLLPLEHNGHTRFRMSVNPEYIINRIELGTSGLDERINAVNKMYRAGYTIGLNVAPVILLHGYEKMYEEMFERLSKGLDPKLKDEIYFEVILLTFGLANEKINAAGLKGVPDIFNRDLMRPKGRGKYCYREDVANEAHEVIRKLISRYFPNASIKYMI